MFDLNTFISSSKRIFVVSKKPTGPEFNTMAKITGLGIVLIGIIGFMVMLFFKVLGIGI